MIVYKQLTFPNLPQRPYFFSNFVQTIDGRTVILDTTAYEPIGSPTDFATFLDLRTFADALIHGKHTAATHRTVDTITKPEFLEKREKQKKPKTLPYFVITNHPDESLLPALINNQMELPYIVTHKKAVVPKAIETLATIVRIGEKEVDLIKLASFLFQKGYKHVLVEGGPTLMGSFFSEDLLDELFVTIAPKIISGKQTEFLTMTEGTLIPPQLVKTWKLISMKSVNSELFLRYKK